MNKISYGYCHCGCGQKTKISKETRFARGIVKGQPYNFIRGHQQFIDLTGRKFGRLTVIRRVGKRKGGDIKWACECQCGQNIIVSANHLKDGHTKSCGCLRHEISSIRMTKHGMSKTLTYRTWASMKSRCQNPNEPRYKDYGGRGISVCDRWLKFENFLEDMGEKPRGLTLDRKNNDRGYCKENCKWSSKQEQARNRRMVKFTKSDVRTIKKCLRDGVKQKLLAQKYGVATTTINAIAKNKNWKGIE